MLRHAKKGFTLPELMLVAAILVLAAAVCIPAAVKARAYAFDAVTVAELRGLYGAMSGYLWDNGEFPRQWSDLTGYVPDIAVYERKYELNPAP